MRGLRRKVKATKDNRQLFTKQEVPLNNAAVTVSGTTSLHGSCPRRDHQQRNPNRVQDQRVAPASERVYSAPGADDCEDWLAVSASLAEPIANG